MTKKVISSRTTTRRSGQLQLQTTTACRAPTPHASQKLPPPRPYQNGRRTSATATEAQGWAFQKTQTIYGGCCSEDAAGRGGHSCAHKLLQPVGQGHEESLEAAPGPSKNVLAKSAGILKPQMSSSVPVPQSSPHFENVLHWHFCCQAWQPCLLRLAPLRHLLTWEHPRTWWDDS